MIESPLHGRLAARGAHFGAIAGAEVARSYGDAAAEYRAATGAAGLVDRNDLGHVRLRGRAPAKMLHGMITNDLLGAPADRVVYAAMLTPKGRAIADLRAVVRSTAEGEEVLAEVPREAMAGVLEHLRRSVPPLFARWEDASERLGTLGVYGPRAHEVVGRVLGELPPLAEDERTERAWDGARDPGGGGGRVLVVGTRLTGDPGVELTAGAEVLPALWDALRTAGAAVGAHPVGHDVLETLRVEAGRPRYGHELTEETIPTEVFEAIGQMPRAVSFTKGCYTGQEVIVRIAHRGHVNRHLRGVRLGALAVPEAGTPLLHPESGRPVGRVTSAAVSPRWGETIALALVRREVEPESEVQIGESGRGRVVELPFR